MHKNKKPSTLGTYIRVVRLLPTYMIIYVFCLTITDGCIADYLYEN